MKEIGQNHIDYWQCFYPLDGGQKNRSGVRLREGRCWALFQLGDDEPFTFGNPYEFPLELSHLPSYIRFIVDHELLDYPNSDLAEVLVGKKSFQAALDSQAKIEPKRETTTRTFRQTS